MKLTADILAAAYDLLCLCPPFAGWRLPPSDDVGFVVTHDRNVRADFTIVAGFPTIRVSADSNGSLASAIMVIAHEMIHLHQHLVKCETKNTEHNADFRRRAAQICRVHHWDLQAFL